MFKVVIWAEQSDKLAFVALFIVHRLDLGYYGEG